MSRTLVTPVLGVLAAVVSAVVALASGLPPADLALVLIVAGIGWTARVYGYCGA